MVHYQGLHFNTLFFELLHQPLHTERDRGLLEFLQQIDQNHVLARDKHLASGYSFDVGLSEVFGGDVELSFELEHEFAEARNNVIQRFTDLSTDLSISFASSIDPKFAIRGPKRTAYKILFTAVRVTMKPRSRVRASAFA